jgi:hypothetical protein
LHDPEQRLHIKVQSVSHPNRVHLDIETDDIEAKLSRIEPVDARAISRVRTWVAMEAPPGQRLYVVCAKGKRDRKPGKHLVDAALGRHGSRVNYHGLWSTPPMGRRICTSTERKG